MAFSGFGGEALQLREATCRTADEAAEGQKKGRPERAGL